MVPELCICPEIFLHLLPSAQQTMSGPASCAPHLRVSNAYQRLLGLGWGNQRSGWQRSSGLFPDGGEGNTSALSLSAHSISLFQLFSPQGRQGKSSTPILMCPPRPALPTPLRQAGKTRRGCSHTAALNPSAQTSCCSGGHGVPQTWGWKDIQSSPQIRRLHHFLGALSKRGTVVLPKSILNHPLLLWVRPTFPWSR